MGYNLDSPLDKGAKFSCTKCSACCRHDPGLVYLSENDVKALARAKNIGRKEFLLKYTCFVTKADGVYYSLLEKDNYDCIFWEQGCTVYEARPRQCRSYPFWESIVRSEGAWQRETQDCPGMNRGKYYSPAEIQSIVRKQSQEKLLRTVERSPKNCDREN